MRSFLLTITALLVISNGALCFTANSAMEEQVLKHIARSVSEFAAYKLRNSQGPVLVSVENEVEPLAEFTLIPPITEDPLTLPPVNEENIDIALGELLSVTGNLAITDPQVKGLTQLTDTLNFVYIALNGALTIDIDVKLPLVQLLSPYELDLILTILSEQSTNLAGIGELSVGASDLFLTFHGKGKVPPPIIGTGNMSLEELDVDLGFKNLQFSLADLSVDGTPNDLSHFAGLIESAFGLIWTDTNKALVNEMIRCAIDDLVNTCKIGEIVGGDTSCLEKPIRLECFGLVTPTEPPSPSEPTDPSTGSTDDLEETTVDSSRTSYTRPEIFSTVIAILTAFRYI